MMIGPADPTQRASSKTVRGQPPRGGVWCRAARPQPGSGAPRTDQDIGNTGRAGRAKARGSIAPFFKKRIVL